MGVSALELRRRVLMAQPHKERKTGGIVSFKTHVPQVLPVSVDLLPVQVGTGDPSPENVRPISGWTGTNIGHAGKNLLGGIVLADAVVSSMPSATIYPDVKYVSFAENATTQHVINGYGASDPKVFGFKFKENTQYTFIMTCSKNTSANTNLCVAYTDGTNDYLPSVTEYGVKQTKVLVSAEGKTIRALYKRNAGGTTHLYYEESGIFEGVLTEQDFEEWAGIVYHVTFPALGKNLLPGMESGAINQSTGQDETDNTVMRCVGYIPVEPGETYTLGTLASSGNIRFFGYDKEKNYIGNAVVRNVTNATYTIGSGTYFIRFQGATERFAGVDLQFEKGESHTAYEPFNNTVYGGTLNLTTGELTVEWRKLIFTSSTSVSNTGTTNTGTWCTQSISASGENQGYGGNTPNAGDGNGLFSLGGWRYSAVTGERRAYYRYSTVRAVLFSPEHDMRTAEGRQAFYDAIGGSAEVVYRIKTPRTYQLTPAEIRALIGINCVFSDAGDVTVEFWTN